MSYEQYWRKIHETNNKLDSLLTSYWKQYSDFANWQFWTMVLFLVIPLIILCFKVDRKRIFEVFFFGYTVHVLWTYVDIALGRSGHLIHPYFLTPLLPDALSLTASILPVGYLLLYQYCTNHKKNFYLYTLLLSAVFAFGLAPIEGHFRLVDARKGMNLFYLYLIDLGVVFISYWFTKLILKLRDGREKGEI
ncbi:hypothetical protein IUK39_03550 [Priestia aryabhattai]|uniref:hypothetical protein n=1 Tax=Priestia aryabhattai TaxID=412384 RepID=UPI001C0D0635|nr:hypothetical protein [Priestia aryabhattai]MBU3569253.1 hypothetical protein [Priestia aryabhattai]